MKRKKKKKTKAKQGVRVSYRKEEREIASDVLSKTWNILFPIKIRVIIRRHFCADKEDGNLVNERLLCSMTVRPAQSEK
jgi:hypothetical protein